MLAEVTHYVDKVLPQGETITAYMIRVRVSEEASYVTAKRYSDFNDLYDELKDLLPEFYKFPNKSLFNNNAQFTKERRVRGFDEMLKLLSGLPVIPQQLLTFLELDERVPPTELVKMLVRRQAEIESSDFHARESIHDRNSDSKDPVGSNLDSQNSLSNIRQSTDTSPINADKSSVSSEITDQASHQFPPPQPPRPTTPLSSPKFQPQEQQSSTTPPPPPPSTPADDSTNPPQFHSPSSSHHKTAPSGHSGQEGKQITAVETHHHNKIHYQETHVHTHTPTTPITQHHHNTISVTSTPLPPSIPPPLPTNNSPGLRQRKTKKVLKKQTKTKQTVLPTSSLPLSSSSSSSSSSIASKEQDLYFFEIPYVFHDESAIKHKDLIKINFPAMNRNAMIKSFVAFLFIVLLDLVELGNANIFQVLVSWVCLYGVLLLWEVRMLRLLVLASREEKKL